MSEIKVNKISPRTACGTTTLGDSGDTFTIPAGVSITNSGTASGFGATGAVSWNTTVKTSGFTATTGEGYFVNTTGGAVSVNLPAGTAGAVVGFRDYAGTFDTNAVTLVRNGSDKIGGSTDNATLSTEGIAVTLVFIDSTQGWLVTDSGLQSEAPGPEYIVATGGTETTCGDYKIHTFTGPGTLSVTSTGNVAGNNQVEYLVVAGGGSGGNNAGGAGAGGFRFASPSISPLTYPAKPLAGSTITLTGNVPVAVGAGGAGAPYCGTPTGGVNSTFSTISSAGGGRGGSNPGSNAPGVGTGGSGGGGSYFTPNPCATGGVGNTPPVSPPQGNPGGTTSAGPYPTGAPAQASGGGGALAAGTNSTSSIATGGPGGVGGGLPTAFGSNGIPSGSFRYYAGGGGGASQNSSPGDRGIGGLGGGGTSAIQEGTAEAGTANTGGGGGGAAGGNGTSGSGGSGIVVIRYKFQN